MDFPDDFEQDSDEEQPEGIFMTDIDSTAPVVPEIPIFKPAPNVYPLINVARQVISASESLMYFGNSSLGRTVTSPIFEYPKLIRSIAERFPSYAASALSERFSPEFRLSKLYKSAKAKLSEQLTLNGRLKQKIRMYTTSLSSQPTSTVSKQEEHATEVNLRKAIQQIHLLKDECAKLKEENEGLLQRSEELIKKASPKTRNGQYNQLSESILRLTIAIKTDRASYVSDVKQAERYLENLARPVDSLDQRLSNLEMRIRNTHSKPFARKWNSPHSISEGLPPLKHPPNSVPRIPRK